MADFDSSAAQLFLGSSLNSLVYFRSTRAGFFTLHAKRAGAKNARTLKVRLLSPKIAEQIKLRDGGKTIASWEQKISLHTFCLKVRLIPLPSLEGTTVIMSSLEDLLPLVNFEHL